MHKFRVAIIGGGCAGLAAASALAERGYSVTLFEAAPQLGGRARAINIKINHGLQQLDNGQHILLGAYRETLTLLKKVGVNEQHAFSRIPLQIHLRSKDGDECFRLKSFDRLPAPFHFIAGLLLSQGLSMTERFKAISLMVQLRLTGFKISNDLPLAQFLQDRGQTQHLIQYLWEPLCLAAVNTPIHEASTQIFLNILKDSFTGKKSDSDLLLPKQDLSQLLCAPFSHYVQSKGGAIHLNQRIDTITPEENGYRLKANHVSEYFSHVVVAVSPFNAARLLQKLPDVSDTLEIINSYDYQPIYTVYLEYPSESVLPLMMTGLSGTISQWVFNRDLLCSQKNLLSVIISAEGPHQHIPQQALALKVSEELERAFPHLGKPLWTKVIAEKRATFMCRPDLRRPNFQTKHPNLYLAGDYTYCDYPATIEGAVRSGLKCAELIDSMN